MAMSPAPEDWKPLAAHEADADPERDERDVLFSELERARDSAYRAEQQLRAERAEHDRLRALMAVEPGRLAEAVEQSGWFEPGGQWQAMSAAEKADVAVGWLREAGA